MSDRTKAILKGWVIPYTAFFIVVLLVSRYVFFFPIVPTGSMIPTIDEGSYLFAWRVHNIDKLERGDIVVFDSEELGKTMVKRLIGLPGDTVVIDDGGSLYINDERIDEPYVKNPSPISGEFVVPEGHLFFLGDNRSGSYDARSWNQPYIDADKVQGRAVFTFLPLHNFGVLK